MTSAHLVRGRRAISSSQPYASRTRRSCENPAPAEVAEEVGVRGVELLRLLGNLAT